jgi:lipopolysaccharide transport system ATP-binding protein
VAAHLEPEILLVDEVLAVGDAAFQKKCLGKMGDVAKEGRTVLFVSHNLEAVLSLCPQTFVLNNGAVVFQGESEKALSLYLNSSSNDRPSAPGHLLYQATQAGNPDKTQIDTIEILDQAGNPKPIIHTWDDLILRVHYSAAADIQSGTIILDIRDFKQQRLIVLDSGLKIPLRKGSHYVDCLIPRLPLAAGDFYLGAGLGLSNSQWLWRETNLATFQVRGKDVFEIGRPATLSRTIFVIPHDWFEVKY